MRDKIFCRVIYFDASLDEANSAAMRYLSITLRDYFDVDADKTLKLCEKLVDNDKRGHETETLIHALFDKKDYTLEVRDKIRAFLFMKTISLQMNSHCENQILYFLENSFGFDVMFRLSP